MIVKQFFSNLTFLIFQQKDSAWEGGIRSASAIWSPLLKERHRVSKDVMYVADWLPTLTSLAGVRIPLNTNLDGINQWRSLSQNSPGLRDEVVHNIDPKTPYVSYMFDGWKYVNGTRNPLRDIWMGDIPTDENPDASLYFQVLQNSDTWKSLKKFSRQRIRSQDVYRLRDGATIRCKKTFLPNVWHPVCEPKVAPCLFDVLVDPCEQFNLANSHKKKVRQLQSRLAIIQRSVVYPINQPLDPRCDPELYNDLWTYWLDIIDEQSNLDIRRI